MKDSGQDKVIAFDTLFTTNHIQVLKILLTYIPVSQQSTLAVYIKFLELQYTISFYRNHPACTVSLLPCEEAINASKLCEELFPLCNKAEQEQLAQMKSMYQNLENVQEMMKTMEMMKSMFPEGENPFGGNSDMDISQIFDMFQTLNDK